MQKYSCSAPRFATTLFTFLFPRSFSILMALLLMTLIDLMRGVFLSRASPVYERKTDGMQRVEPMPLLSMKAGLDGSHAVYPRASKVERIPPLGKLEASGSP